MRRILLICVLLALIVSPFSVAAQSVDPRSENARAYHMNAAGMVDGVELVYQERPDTKYQLVQARLVDEASAGGNTVAKFVVIDCYGTPTSENVYLAWPWPGMDGGKLLPGNQNSEHMIMNYYVPPNIGPLAIYVGDSQGRIISDVVGGLGLPAKRHVSFYLAFRQRCSAPATPTPIPSPQPGPTVTPGPTPPPAPTEQGIAAAVNRLANIFAWFLHYPY
jgi:hypothetical protein